jgi:hypothetical protein
MFGQVWCDFNVGFGSHGLMNETISSGQQTIFIQAGVPTQINIYLSIWPVLPLYESLATLQSIYVLDSRVFL